MVNKRPPKLDLKKTFLGLQKEMALKLGNARLSIGHPVAKGDVTENSWREMLGTYLPRRYAVEKAFIVDADGDTSEQIDLVIFDRHFSPFLFHQAGACYIPAESVYGVFEIKQEVGKAELTYAGRKAESVRNLKRTSAHITHAGGFHEPVVPKEIIGGLLCLKSRLKGSLASTLGPTLLKMPARRRLDLVCSLEHGAINIDNAHGPMPALESFPAEQALIQFFLALLIKLQAMGSVPAIDIRAYGKYLGS